ncbi:ribonucleotide-diphosphate reductase beta subunit [Parvularcula bermudensis HTCC2503]|uniref:Ribonucleotide-diphosphate reductase beta subunit n=1 Tax=Parvularcula bermudensis (strain ATCC BAA-594 / HTCC2503 / KCTC 12087) TaxID=314260 RepID=E0TFZ1_PARBH|nr:ribonucleotide-diphosphate reductase beta subunit [Parvularcula bermudensis HTCC2503]
MGIGCDAKGRKGRERCLTGDCLPTPIMGPALVVFALLGIF